MKRELAFLPLWRARRRAAKGRLTPGPVLRGSCRSGIGREAFGIRSISMVAALCACAPTTVEAQTAPASPTPQTAPPASPTPAETPPAAGPPPPPPTFAQAGPWSFTGVINVDALDNIAGGLKSGPAVLVKGALSAAYDGSQQGHDGLTGLVSAQYVNGTRFSGHFVGDTQGLDNIEASGAIRLYEVWLAHDYHSSTRGWKAGLIDLNSEFDTQETAGLFLNSSDGVGAELGHSGVNGPSIFPTTALGTTFYLRPSSALTFRLGIFDGTAGSPAHPGRFAVHLSGRDGILAIGQVERRVDDRFRVEGGLWAYSARFDDLHRVDDQGNPVRERRSRGGYVLIEGKLASIGDGDDRGLSGWVRMGIADPVVQTVSSYTGAGLVLTGALKQRPSDQAGIAINRAIVDDGDPVNSLRRPETTIETTYRYNATDWLAVQPDAQLIFRPGGSATVPTAFAVGLRFNITLTKNLVARLKSQAP